MANINRGAKLHWPKREVWTSTGEGRLHHTCEENAGLWRVVKPGAGPFQCPECRAHFEKFHRFEEDLPGGFWRIHGKLIIGTRSVEIRALECPRCLAVGRNITERLGIEAIQCRICDEFITVTPEGIVRADPGVNINVPTAGTKSFSPI